MFKLQCLLFQQKRRFKMNHKFIQSAALGSIMIGVLAFSNFNANANGFNKNINKNGKSISTNQFYDILNKTENEDVSKTFGKPDSITTLRNDEGELAGVIWTYQDAVFTKGEELDANFVYVAGQFKYVSLTNS